MGLEIGRKAALPLYLLWPNDEIPAWKPETDEWGNSFAGRVVTWRQARFAWEAGVEREPRSPLPHSEFANLTERDIVYVPLYSGVDHGPEKVPEPGRGIIDPLPRRIMEPNLRGLELIAPRAQSVLVGNLGPECAFAPYPREELGEFELRAMARRHIRFVEGTSEIIRTAGGRPAYAPVPIELRGDMYALGGEIREAYEAAGAQLILFCGYEHFEDQGCVPGGWEQATEDPPNPVLAEYVRGLDAICGMGYTEGLQARNDVMAAWHGFVGGVVGVR